ncbi:nuclease s1 [Trichodelitschia bisporula]|uniref:Nuclease s1 n=1 Tax=Trichodelitschia bisporula TaxID=703511 RepID=A0A6G1I6C7_9PEZI|nr:nuclease s1 [Trichodelitschia bisporula]
MSTMRALFILSTLASSVFCWGNLGHRTVALLAEQDFTEEAQAFAKQLLNGTDIDTAAIWADKYKDTPDGRPTGSWHFVNANDTPPLACDVVPRRDCAQSCILNVIPNMARLLRSLDTTLPEKMEAFNFLIHLVGDLHMPLHVEGLARGGNDIHVTFAAEPTTLHIIWDVHILQKRAAEYGTDERAAAKRWAQELHNRSYDLTSRAAGLQHYLSDPHPVDLAQPEEEILAWAQESNSWVCRYVLKDGQTSVSGRELSGGYYEGAVPIVDELIWKAGKRLASWINALAAEQSRSPVGP